MRRYTLCYKKWIFLQSIGLQGVHSRFSRSHDQWPEFREPKILGRKMRGSWIAHLGYQHVPEKRYNLVIRIRIKLCVIVQFPSARQSLKASALKFKIVQHCQVRRVMVENKAQKELIPPPTICRSIAVNSKQNVT